MDIDEREAIEAVYCQPGECCFEGNTVTINMHIGVGNECDGSEGTKVPVKIVLSVQGDYPQTVPDISILSEHLHRDIISRMKLAVAKNFEDYLGEPMVTAICAFLHDEIKLELEHVIGDRDSNKSLKNFQDRASKESLWTSLLHIDHMRSKNKYCKTLEKWVEELQLNGRILFLRRLILVILQGNHGSVKEFIMRLKTVNVDVDSKGHSCKERMMKVLSEGTCDSSPRFLNFKKCEFTEESELHNLFLQHGLTEYWENVIPLLKQFH